MRWNCPHCQTALTITEDHVGPNWSLTRCVRCGGFALIRKSEVNLIKVDQPPNGSDHALIPEQVNDHYQTKPHSKPSLASTSAPPSTIAQQTVSAEQNHSIAKHLYARHQQANHKDQANQMAKSFIKTSHAGKLEGTTKARVGSRSQKRLEDSPKAFEYPTTTTRAEFMPEPLPAPPKINWKKLAFPISVGMVGIATIASGVYLFTQSKNLIQVADRESPPLSDQIRQEYSKNVPVTSPDEVASLDDVEESELPFDDEEALPVGRALDGAMVPANEAETVANIKTTDIQSNATDPASQQKRGVLTVRVVLPNAKLRSGPGDEYGIIGTAQQGWLYRVIDFDEDWLRVVPEKSAGKKLAPKAWILNRSVKKRTQAKNTKKRS